MTTIKRDHPHLAKLREAGFSDVADHWQAMTLPPRPRLDAPWEQARAEQAIKMHLREAYHFMRSEDHFPRGSTLRNDIRRMWETWDKFAEGLPPSAAVAKARKGAA
jgi:hypothetical protein